MDDEIRSALLAEQIAAAERFGEPLDAMRRPGVDIADDVHEAIIRRQFPFLSEDEIGASVKRQEDAIRALREAAPTELEDPLLYGLLLSHAGDIARAAVARNWEVSGRVQVGTKPGREPEAKILSFKDGQDHLLIFNRGVFSYLHSASTSLAALVPMAGTEVVLDEVSMI
jgi:hypothetical protein